MACGGRRLAFARRWKFDTRSPRLRQSNRYGLFRGAGPVLALADMIHLLANELPSLGGRRLSLPPIALRSFQGSLFRHDCSDRTKLSDFTNLTLLGD